MRSSIALGDHRCSGFVLRPADTLWSEFWNGNGAGTSERLGQQAEARRKKLDPCVDKTLPISSGHIAVTAAVSIISTCTQEEEGGAKSAKWVQLRSLFFIHRKEQKWNWNFTNWYFVTSD
jgi:hypothetical protein